MHYNAMAGHGSQSAHGGSGGHSHTGGHESAGTGGDSMPTNIKGEAVTSAATDPSYASYFGQLAASGMPVH